MEILNHNDIADLAKIVADQIRISLGAHTLRVVPVYPIPRGGIPAALAVKAAYGHAMVLVNRPEDAIVFIDDIIDSGATMRKYCDAHPGKGFFALVDKVSYPDTFEDWVAFPWEVSAEGTDHSGTDIVTRLLQFVGEDPTRGGLLETPARVLKAWRHWTSGYKTDIPGLLKTFEDGADGCDEMVIVKDIPFYTHCEHHMAPFFGTATVAYIPDGKIVGLSKLSRVVDAFARRLQVQERLTNQVADALWENLAPKGVGVVIRARHLCMESRGICQQGHHTITSALRGVMRDSAAARSEFMDLAR